MNIIVRHEQGFTDHVVRDLYRCQSKLRYSEIDVKAAVLQMLKK